MHRHGDRGATTGEEVRRHEDAALTRIEAARKDSTGAPAARASGPTRRLIVALHSHAFLCLAMLLLFVSLALQRWLAPDGGALHVLFDAVGVALWIRMPLYLLPMQKRVLARAGR